MPSSPNLSLPYIAAAQAQKHVTHNDAIRALDALVHLAVLDRDLTSPPASITDGDRYIVATNPTGSWLDHAGDIAAFQDGAWSFLSPRSGWQAWLDDEAALATFDGTNWISAGSANGSGINPTPLVGVNTTADASNRLSVAAANTLLTHDGDDHRLKINKADTADTASVVFQNAFSGRAEFGLAGDDNWRVKVSGDGLVWNDALIADRSTGAIAFPNGGGVNPNLLINGDFKINQRLFAGGPASAGDYVYDRWRAASGGASLTLASGVLTLTSGTIEQLVEPGVIAGKASLANTTVTISVDTPTADLTVTFGSASGIITAGSPRRALTLTTAPGDTGPLSLSLTATSSAPTTIANVKLELGAVATAWDPRPSTQEMSLAQRYYHRVQNTGNLFLALSPGPAITSSRVFGMLTLPQPMRAQPALTASGLYLTNFITNMDPITTFSVYSISANNRELMLDCTAPVTNPLITPTTWYFFGLGAGSANFLAFSAEL